MKKHQICIMLSDMQYGHFRSLLESEGCESVTEMFRKCVFGRWPIKKQPSAASSKAVPTVESTMPQHGHNHAATMPEHGKEEKKEEREKSPHTPLKEKEARKEGCCCGARGTSGEDGISLAEAIRAAESIPSLGVDLRKPPTLAEAIAYARLRMKHIPPEFIRQWHSKMVAQNWIMSNGGDIRNWSAILLSWWENRGKHERGKRIAAALERDVAALEKRVELTEKANAAREAKQNAAASANANSRYHNGRPKLSNHVDISEEERNEILEGFGF